MYTNSAVAKNGVYSEVHDRNIRVVNALKNRITLHGAQVCTVMCCC